MNRWDCRRPIDDKYRKTTYSPGLNHQGPERVHQSAARQFGDRADTEILEVYLVSGVG